MFTTAFAPKRLGLLDHALDGFLARLVQQLGVALNRRPRSS
jgi:hypothetical protein